jgi:Hexameric tyrosine-coordinated heme protein (HTHP)
MRGEMEDRMSDTLAKNMLITETAEEGRQLAIMLARSSVKATQPDAKVRGRLRPLYAENASDLIAVAQVVAIEFATIAAANDYWRK